MVDGRSTTRGPLDPLVLPPAELARLLSAFSRQPVTVAMLQADIEAGAPTNPDGTINLIHYVAWLIKESGRGT